MPRLTSPATATARRPMAANGGGNQVAAETDATGAPVTPAETDALAGIMEGK